MRWQGRRGSGNIIDRRAMGGGLAIGGGGAVIVLLIALLTGIDPTQLLQQLPQEQLQPRGSVPVDPEEERLKEFVSVVLADTEDVWHAQFAQLGREYYEPSLVLFNGQVSSACGYASSAVGPFYCPGDQHVYLDLSFFDELHRRFGAAGDFAQAYVIAHEVGHHVQRQLGITQRLDQARGQLSQEDYNELSVRLELQADFLAGLWAHHAERQFQSIEPGDIEEALRAASAIGDDTLQKQQQGYVVPDSFTHGTSEQRMRWFLKGYETGDIKQGDTFSARTL